MVDSKAGAVIAPWPVARGGQPVGMAIDRRAPFWLGCRGPHRLSGRELSEGRKVVDGGQLFAGTGGSKLFVAGLTAIRETVTTGKVRGQWVLIPPRTVSAKTYSS